MMSLLRILLGVVVGVGFFAGLVVLGREFPVAAARVFMLLMCWGVCTLMVWMMLRGLRLGVTGGRFSRYERALKPVHFWFYISFYCFLGVVFFVLGACSIFAPRVLSLR